MCQQEPNGKCNGGRSKGSRGSSVSSTTSIRIPPPDVDTITLPPSHILAHLTDAHCHPTDLASPDYDGVQLGGIASMAVNKDQHKVSSLASSRPWRKTSSGPKVVAAFGYHPWFVHQYALTPTTKEAHYTALFNPKDKDMECFKAILPTLPDPLPFGPCLDRMREDIMTAREAGYAMVGEIGLDATAKIHCGDKLSPFKTSMTHQIAIARAQLQLAEELDVPVSFHCVAASGHTLDLLKSFPSVRVDLHSLGGMSGNFLMQVAKTCKDVYFSPSILVTGRNKDASAAIAAIPRDRVLVESDTHDVARADKLVWGAVLWIAEVRGWKVEKGEDGEEWGKDEDEVFDSHGKIVPKKEDEVWAVRTLEKNWSRFLGITA